MALLTIKLIITIIAAFFIMLGLDKVISTKKFNLWYVKQCRKALHTLPDEQRALIIEWLKSNLTGTLEGEMSAKDIIACLPLNLRSKLTERRMRALMYEVGYMYLSDCFLDPAYYAVALKTK